MSLDHFAVIIVFQIKEAETRCMPYSVTPENWPLTGCVTVAMPIRDNNCYLSYIRHMRYCWLVFLFLQWCSERARGQRGRGVSRTGWYFLEAANRQKLY